MALQLPLLNEKYPITHLELKTKLEVYGVSHHFDLGSAAVKTITALTSHYNNVRQDMFPGIETMAYEVNCSEATIYRGLRELKEKNLIKIEKKGRGNLYHFTMKLRNYFHLKKLGIDIDLDSYNEQAPDNPAPEPQNNIPEAEKVYSDTIPQPEPTVPTTVYEEKPVEKQPEPETNTIPQPEKVQPAPVSDPVPTPAKPEKTEYTEEQKQDYRQVATTLEKWCYHGRHQLIQKYGTDVLKEAIAFIIAGKFANPGAYLRILSKNDLQEWYNDRLQEIKQAKVKQEQEQRQRHEQIKKIEEDKNKAQKDKEEREKYTREQALAFCRGLHPKSRGNMSVFKDLVKKYNITEEELNSEEPTENLTTNQPKDPTKPPG